MTKNIIAIDDFMAQWKSRAMDYYTAEFNTYQVVSKAWTEAKEVGEKNDRKDGAVFYHRPYPYTIEKFGQRGCSRMSDEEQAAFDKAHNFFMGHGKGEWELVKLARNQSYLSEFLDKEVKNKKARLIARVEKKAGTIQNASMLKVGHNGEINGLVIGEKATVKVSTIYAGGYNIQCLHYRVLVK